MGAEFILEVFDWNQIEQAKTLGVARIELADIEPFESVDRVVQLTSEKHGQKGQIHVRLMFRPEIIAKSRKNTSTFSTAGRAMTQIGSLPVGAGKGVVHGFTGVFKRGGKSVSSESDDDDAVTPTPPAVPMPAIREKRSEPSLNNKRSFPDLAAGQASRPLNGATLGVDGFTPGDEDGDARARDGLLRVTVIDAKDMTANDVKPYVAIRVGDKERKTKHLHKTETPEW